MRSRLIERAERRGREEARRRTEELSAALRERLSGCLIEAWEAEVMISGKGLLKRWLTDPELRFLIGDGQ
jgi:hypothetical protein